MPTITTDYFVGEIHLSQVGASASAKVNNNNSLQQAIDQYDVEVVEMAMGNRWATEYFDNLDPITGDVVFGANPKWSLLIDGDQYEYGNQTYYWRGMRTETGVLRRSLIAYYTYYQYKVRLLTQESTLGSVKAVAENTIKASALPKMVNAWRRFYEWYGNDCVGIHNTPNVTYKRGGVIIDYFGSSRSSDVSLATYLSHKKSDFPDYEFTPIDENKNQYQL